MINIKAALNLTLKPENKSRLTYVRENFHFIMKWKIFHRNVMKLRMITSDTVQHSLEHSVHQSLCKSQAIILMMMMISFCIFKEWHIVRRFNLHSTKDHSVFTRACIKLSHVRTNKTLFTGVKECFKRRIMCVCVCFVLTREDWNGNEL